MKSRRFSMRKDEAEIVKLALRITLQTYEQMELWQRKDPYYTWMKSRIEELLKTLEEYQWEV